MNINQIEIFLRNNLKVTDIDFHKAAKMFVENGGYKSNLSFNDNMDELIKTIAFGKANNIF